MMNDFTIAEVRAFWDKVAKEYTRFNAKVGYVHTQRFEKAMVFGDVQSGQRILNIWSRTGSLIPWLRAVPDVIIENREVSPAMMAIAEHRFSEETFKLTDLEDLSEFGDDTFDRIISLETLEHTPKPLVFLQELHRVLKPGGMLVMSLPPRGAEVPEFFYTLFFEDHGEGPHRFLWPSEVKHLLRSAGLSLLSHHPFILLPLVSDALTRGSERILTFLFGRTPIANFGVRHFYVAEKPLRGANAEGQPHHIKLQ